MLIVAGLSLKNLRPRVWDKTEPFYLSGLRAVMVSYAEFVAAPWWRRKAEAEGLHKALGVSQRIKIYLDNGAFALRGRGGGEEPDRKEYESFVKRAKPDWYPIPYDAIPMPFMTDDERQRCFDVTMANNYLYRGNGCASVVHVGPMLANYTASLRRSRPQRAKENMALGGMVPNLLRAGQAMPYDQVLADLRHAREAFSTQKLHVFGIGGTATVHLAMLLSVDSADSSGWRNRAARGIIQLPGSGDRMIAGLGKWRGRVPSRNELRLLKECPCPACRLKGVKGLKAEGVKGFEYRATHNLWVLLEEAKWVKDRLRRGNYARVYEERLDNSAYTRLITSLVKDRLSLERDLAS